MSQEFLDSIDKVCSKRSKEGVYNNATVRQCTISKNDCAEYFYTGNPPKKLPSLKEVRGERNHLLKKSQSSLISLQKLLAQMDEGKQFEKGFLSSYLEEVQTNLSKLEIGLGRDNLI